MRTLITGVTGFIGSHLAERLLAQGVAVRGLARRPADAAWLAERGAEIVQADLAQRAELARAMQGCDAVLHSAAWTGGPELGEHAAWTVNVAATGWLLQAAQVAGVQRFVYFSSVAVYGLNPAPLIDETAPTPPVGQLYPDSKIAAETLVRTAQTDGLPTTIIRPASNLWPTRRGLDGRPGGADQGWPAGAVGRGSRPGQHRLHRQRGGGGAAGAAQPGRGGRDLQSVRRRGHHLSRVL
ncbi:MAG: NAD-dependent epimerase/dehydratase family protein [Anaerolineae bacterium]